MHLTEEPYKRDSPDMVLKYKTTRIITDGLCLGLLF